ncbi:MAG: ribonuclease H-like domain-containing protein [Nitrospiraceae bacterium]
MLTSTFVFLHGIGPATERRFWQGGLLDWPSFLAQPRVDGLSPDRKAWYDGDLALAQSQLDAGRMHWFASRLQSREHWRFYDACRSRTVYLDIETTGASPHEGDVTVVGLHRNGRTSSLVRGESLTTERLQAELDPCELLVTFFGTGFDVPYLRAAFPGLRLPPAHFDLCFAARRLGLRGGLKRIEQEIGVEREPALRGLDGWDAIRLWSQWRRGNHAALELLLAYNAADTENLVPLTAFVHEHMMARFGPAAVRPVPSLASVARSCAP